MDTIVPTGRVPTGRVPSRLATSRAVTRPVQPGSATACAHCSEPVRYSAKARQEQVIANVYCGGRWARVEHFHSGCYDQVGQPHGTPRP